MNTNFCLHILHGTGYTFGMILVMIWQFSCCRNAAQIGPELECYFDQVSSDSAHSLMSVPVMPSLLCT